ncbi:hypothetical protein PVMG_02276 [Plasmodium vivax Mauritania I]|uniref:Uncharacterized protein n=1 Tax=Plasmodium vivax Mauritania I TaxID=1035515 RepID=A0A0J9TEW8_PLAVI|nr:hypothetical protein PVMG_02276 [Plasmodium vivax Mauritania I]
MLYNIKYPYHDKLTSKKLYDEWNEGEIRGYNNACLNLPRDLKPYELIDKLCRRLARNLDNMQFYNHEKYYLYGRCKLLNYWLYEKVKEIISTSLEANYEKAMESLHSEWKEYNRYTFPFTSEDKKCKPDPTIINLNDTKDKKRIHEHCLNYYEIRKNSNSDEYQKYKVYIKSQSLPYNKFENLFAEDENNNPTYYNQCKCYNPIIIGTDSHCPQENENPEAFEEVAEPLGQTSLDGEEGKEVREEEVRGVGLGAAVAR